MLSVSDGLSYLHSTHGRTDGQTDRPTETVDYIAIEYRYILIKNQCGKRVNNIEWFIIHLPAIVGDC